MRPPKRSRRKLWQSGRSEDRPAICWSHCQYAITASHDTLPLMPSSLPYLRIAAEEAFAPPEMLDQYRKLIEKEPGLDRGFTSLMGFYLGSSPRARQVMSRMTDLSEIRLRDMEDTGIGMQIVSLTSPGVQIFDAATAVSLAQLSNDYL